MDSISDLNIPPLSAGGGMDELDDEVKHVVEMLIGMIERQQSCSLQSRKRAGSCFEISSSSCSSSSSSTSSDDDDDGGKMAANKKKILMRKKMSTAGGSDGTSEEEDEDEEMAVERKKGAKATGLFANYIKTKDELTIDELAPIERLDISVDEKVELVQMGNILSVVDKLVVVESLIEPLASTQRPSNQRPKAEDEVQPLDEDTVLFDSNRKSIGKVFEIFGPVYHPFYSVRFNSVDELKSSGLNLELGAKVLYAPKSDNLTKFIFNLTKLKELKGSDASWNHDQEPPAECLEYSDDEQEKMAKRKLKLSRQGLKAGGDQDDQEDDETLEEGEEQSSSETASNFSDKSSGFNRFNQRNQGNKRPYQQGRPFMPKSNSSYTPDGFAPPTRAYQQGRRSFMPASASTQNFNQNPPQNYAARRPQMNQNMASSFQPNQPLMQQYPTGQQMYPNWPNQAGNMMMMQQQQQQQYPNMNMYATPPPPFMAGPQFYPGNFQPSGQFGQYTPYQMMGSFNHQQMFNPNQPQQQMNQFNPSGAGRPIVDKRFVKNESKPPK